MHLYVIKENTNFYLLLSGELWKYECGVVVGQQISAYMTTQHTCKAKIGDFYV